MSVLEQTLFNNRSFDHREGNESKMELKRQSEDLKIGKFQVVSMQPS